MIVRVKRRYGDRGSIYQVSCDDGIVYYGSKADWTKSHYWTTIFYVKKGKSFVPSIELDSRFFHYLFDSLRGETYGEYHKIYIELFKMLSTASAEDMEKHHLMWRLDNEH